MEEKAVVELDPILTKTGFTKAVEMIYEDMGLNLSKNLGIEYGGVLNNTNAKVAGKGYYDTANKKIYKCTANTSINYADASYFIEVSNNDLLGKLQNLSTAIASNVLTVAVQADTPTDIGTSSNSYVNNITVGVSSLTIQKNGLYNVKINATTYQEAYTKIHAKVNSDVIAVKELDITSGDGAVSSRCLVIDTLAELKKGDKVTFGLTSYRAATYKNVNYSLLLVAE